MPSGPIGPTWVNGSWDDTAWEEHSWSSAVSGAATATITVGATGAGIARRPQVLVSGGQQLRPFIRPIFVHKRGASVAAVGIEADGRGRATRFASSTATVELAAGGRGRKRFTGAAVTSGATVRTQQIGLGAHPIVPVLVRSRRQRYLEALARQPVVIRVPMDMEPMAVRDDDELDLLEVA